MITIHWGILAALLILAALAGLFVAGMCAAAARRNNAAAADAEIDRLNSLRKMQQGTIDRQKADIQGLCEVITFQRTKIKTLQTKGE